MMEFGTYPHTECVILDSIATNNSNVGERMLQLVEKWLGQDNRTGDLPHTALQRWPAYRVCIEIGYNNAVYDEAVYRSCNQCS